MKITFPGLLTLILITLKLTGFIAWSWLWVLAPLWLGLAVFLGVLLVIAVLGGTALGLAAVIDGVRKARRSIR